MAALLTMLAVMAILLSAALPVWRHEMQREREAELVFRGEQYVRAIELFQRRHGPGSLPPSLDILVQQKFLRKKYTDPITGDDFNLVRAGMLQQQGRPGQPGQPAPPGQPGQPARGSQGGSITVTPGLGGPGPGGGIVGVVSKSEEDSIRIYRGRTKYHQWQFVYAGAAQQPGAPGQARPGQLQPGQRQPGGPGPGVRRPARPPGQGSGQPQPLDPRPPG